MSINITRREAAQVYIAAVCSAWVTVLGTGIALTENTASMMRYARRNSPPVPANVAGQAIPAHASATLSHPAIAGIKPGRHLQTFAFPPATCRASKACNRLDATSKTRTAAAPNEPGGQFEIFLPPDGIRADSTHSMRVGAGTSLTSLASAAAHLCAVPEPILFALISVESSWRQTDKAGGTLRSRSGALGLTQIKPSTAREVSATLDPHQASQNAIAGACYLRQQFDRFGDWGIALRAYRIGPNAAALHTSQAARDYSDAIMERGSN